jgi:hypothetical protein
MCAEAYDSPDTFVMCGAGLSIVGSQNATVPHPAVSSYRARYRTCDKWLS